MSCGQRKMGLKMPNRPNYTCRGLGEACFNMHCTLTYHTTAQNSSGVAEEPRPLVQHSTSKSAGQQVSVGTGAVPNGSTAYQPRADAAAARPDSLFW